MRGKQVDAGSEYLGKESSIQIGEIGRGDVEEIERVVDLSHAAAEAFMHETVTVMVNESSDENDPDMVLVSVNGVKQYFRRGVPQEVKRKFLERLARAKRTDFIQDLQDFARNGERVNHLQQRHSLRYPFMVVEDKNPKGAAWLKAILREAN